MDALIEIGTGHVMRCLTFAETTARYGARCRFICRARDGNLISKIKEDGSDTITLPEIVAGSPSVDGKTGQHERWLKTAIAEDVQDTINAFEIRYLPGLSSITMDWAKTEKSGFDDIALS